ncbi:MAG: hypothetical protein A2X12_01160 [Bacteroidetes bacterium GWE2_29_8]|nr:MAG: hypothetical protein A2X12_01160 [Bacteroidetes bacterium GWE2_29_8]OFY14420.1 MAG: hypothetical protein A2X02_01295 [Bacteroidetes bacterium GWF2_29_10]
MTYLFFVITSYIFHLIFEKVNNNKSGGFIMLYLATTMGKMLFYVTCLILYVFVIERVNAKEFIVYFFVFYMYFYVFEFRFMAKSNRDNLK